MRSTSAIRFSSSARGLDCSFICEISILFFANERPHWYHNPLVRRSSSCLGRTSCPLFLPIPGRRDRPSKGGDGKRGGAAKIPIDYCSQRVLITGMSIERSALPLEDGRARPRLDGEPLMLPAAKTDFKKYLDAARIWMRRAMAPGGVTGIIMGLVFVIATDAVLLLAKYIEELPPVSLTFLIPVVLAAIRWGTLSAAITAIGGAGTISLFYYNPFSITGPKGRSRAQAGKRDPRPLYILATNFCRQFAGGNLRGQATAFGNAGGPQGSAVRLAWDAGGKVGAAFRR